MRDDTAFMDRIHAYLPGWDVPKVSKRRCSPTTSAWSATSCLSAHPASHRPACSTLQGGSTFGGALSGRDTTAVHKTVSGLLKLMYPDSPMAVSDEDLEWAVRLALEVRRRVKEQQKRIGSAEFRNTHFSYVLGEEGVEKFVATPELQSEDSIGTDPLPPGQVWAISPGGQDEHSGLFRHRVNEGPGSGVKILNQPAPPPFKESVRCAEQNLYARGRELVGDRDPRAHEFSVQLRASTPRKSGSQVGVAVLCSRSAAACCKKPCAAGSSSSAASTWAAPSSRSTTPWTSSSSPSRRAPQPF
jgi:ATP-dependent Lon protease